MSLYDGLAFEVCSNLVRWTGEATKWFSGKLCGIPRWDFPQSPKKFGYFGALALNQFQKMFANIG